MTANPQFVVYPPEVIAIFNTLASQLPKDSFHPEIIPSLKESLYASGVSAAHLVAAQKVVNARMRSLTQNPIERDDDPWAMYAIGHFLTVANTPTRRDHIVGCLMFHVLVEYAPRYVELQTCYTDPTHAADIATEDYGKDSLRVIVPPYVSALKSALKYDSRADSIGWVRPEARAFIESLDAQTVELSVAMHARLSAELRFIHTFHGDGSLAYR